MAFRVWVFFCNFFIHSLRVMSCQDIKWTKNNQRGWIFFFLVCMNVYLFGKLLLIGLQQSLHANHYHQHFYIDQIWWCCIIYCTLQRMWNFNFTSSHCILADWIWFEKETWQHQYHFRYQQLYHKTNNSHDWSIKIESLMREKKKFYEL